MNLSFSSHRIGEPGHCAHKMPQNCCWCKARYGTNKKEEDKILWFWNNEGQRENYSHQWFKARFPLKCHPVMRMMLKSKTFSKVTTRRSDWPDRVGALGPICSRSHSSDSMLLLSMRRAAIGLLKTHKKFLIFLLAQQFWCFCLAYW